MKNKKRIKKFSVENDGFYGDLYMPSQVKFAGKALIILGGGGVPYVSTLDMADKFSDFGITALAVGYFGVKDTPKTVVKVPVEYVERAADRLHTDGYETVIAVGISKGAEFALAAASLLPQINGVIALSPTSRVNMAVGKGISWPDASSWTFRGSELPYAYAPASGFSAVIDSLRARELTFRYVYERAYMASSSDSIIKAEKINGPVLLAAAADDSLWPGAQSCDEIIKRLDENNFPFYHKRLIYEYASHLLLPYYTSFVKLFRAGRRYPEECRRTAYELQKEILTFIGQCGNDKSRIEEIC